MNRRIEGTFNTKCTWHSSAFERAGSFYLHSA
jgi:hypothetical protein